jgi:SAM-dependent methyltransferase
MNSDGELDFAQNAAFHNEVAAQYDVHLRSSPYNDLARTAFHDLVARYVPAGSTLLDFGCGTGLDALHYAQQGYRVLAYDNSPGMMAQLEKRCRTQIASRAVATCAAAYPSFLDRPPAWPAPNTVVANFAVLNSIRDLSPLFETFARQLRPPGWVIVSILNPLHWEKVNTPEWWHEAWRHPTGPRLFSTRPYRTYLHFLPALLRSAPGFQLVGRANAGAFVRYDTVVAGEQRAWWGHADSPKDRFARVLWQTPVFRLLGHFLFLVLRRDP